MEGQLPTVDDLARDLAYEALRSRRRAQQIDFFLRTYAVLGALTGLGGLAYLGFSLLKIDLNPSQQIALMIAGSGITLAAISISALILRKQRKLFSATMLAETNSIGEIVRQWARFESLGRELLELRGESFNRYSPRAILLALAKDGLISNDEAEKIQKALEIRNRLVHGADEVPADELGTATAILQHINEVLQRASTASTKTMAEELALRVGRSTASQSPAPE